MSETLLGKMHSATRELLGRSVELADRLQGDVVGVSIGLNHDDYAAELTAYGADRVLRLEGYSWPTIRLKGMPMPWRRAFSSSGLMPS